MSRQLQGVFFNSHSSESHKITLTISDDGIVHAEPEMVDPAPIQDLKISRRIGNIPRTITFPSGAAVETDNNKVLDLWLKEYSRYKGITHILESKLSYIFGALAFVAIFLIVSVVWGLPWASKALANMLPSEVSVMLGEGVLDSMDSLVFEPSELEQLNQEKWRNIFEDLLPAETDDISYTLQIRNGGFIGPNAFALPDGTVVLTDELINLAREEEEIQSVLLHEIGHVVNRHGLRRVISHSGLAILVSLFSGDISSAGIIVLAMPSILMESSYSRDLETEADDYSLIEMRRLGIDTVHFANFMLRLESEMTEATSQNEEEEEKNWMNYISSHPPTDERVSRFQADN